ncbi:MAG: bifunctional phosphopantothenoylcysteine decarboxylase/phosphopantothenate--cysteine ligase CoaBC [Gammaproteobacteria bacterium]|jgi:phosphopantothenoylcysteine decarboxylase/phosphopantothenate--cysteine ligase
MSPSADRPLRVLLLMSGSIAAFKVVQLVSRLVQAPVGAEVEVVMTPAARGFIGEASLEGLTGRRVRSETFAAGDHMEHIRLVRWADVVLAAPCTANTLNKLASGIGDDLVGTLFLAHDFTKPWLIAPAMNTRMYEHPTTRASLERLRGMGCTIVEPGSGALACGEVGAGRLAEPEALLAAVLQAAQRQPGAAGPPSTSSRSSAGTTVPLKILVTAGGTRMPLDAVRSIVNSSTGRTGADLAADLAALGHAVTLLTAVDAPHAEDLERLERYDDFDSFERSLRGLLAGETYDLLVQAAAVSDWRPMLSPDGGALTGKLDAEGDTLTLRFARTPKLIASARAWSRNPALRIVAFKLTAGADDAERRRKVAQVLANDGVAAVVANDLRTWPRWEFWTDAERPPEVFDGREGIGGRLAAFVASLPTPETRG